MIPEHRRAWEKEQLLLPVDFTQVRIDPSPLLLLENTSLIKVHSLFNMMGVYIAYVTRLGRLVGVVHLDELVQAIKDANAGKLPPHDLEFEIETEKIVPKANLKRKGKRGSDSDDNADENDALCGARKV